MVTRRTFLTVLGSGLLVPAAYAAGPIVQRRGMTTPATITTAAGYTAYASLFDGSSDYLTRGGDLTGNADGKSGTVSAWIKLGNANNSYLAIVENTNGRFSLSRQNNNKFYMYGYSSAGAIKLQIATNTTYLYGTGWLHLFTVWNTSTGLGKFYVNGVDKTALTTCLDSNLDYTAVNWSIGSATNGGYKLVGELCEVYVNLATALDDPTKFASGGKPISLSADGSLPTGTAPILYHRSPFDVFGVNSGTGGNSTITGALAEGTPP